MHCMQAAAPGQALVMESVATQRNMREGITVCSGLLSAACACSGHCGTASVERQLAPVCKPSKPPRAPLGEKIVVIEGSPVPLAQLSTCLHLRESWEPDGGNGW